MPDGSNSFFAGLRGYVGKVQESPPWAAPFRLLTTHRQFWRQSTLHEHRKERRQAWRIEAAPVHRQARPVGAQIGDNAGGSIATLRAVIVVHTDALASQVGAPWFGRICAVRMVAQQRHHGRCVDLTRAGAKDGTRALPPHGATALGASIGAVGIGETERPRIGRPPTVLRGRLLCRGRQFNIGLQAVDVADANGAAYLLYGPLMARGLDDERFVRVGDDIAVVIGSHVGVVVELALTVRTDKRGHAVHGLARCAAPLQAEAHEFHADETRLRGAVKL